MARRSQNTVTLNLPDLYPKQYNALFTEAKRSYIEGSTKSGKTVGALIWLITQAAQDGHEGEHWWVAPYSHQARIAFDRAKKFLPNEIYTSNETEKYIKLKDAGRIWFKTADNEQSLYGEGVQSMVVDEASRTSWEAFEALRSTIFATDAPFRAIGNVTDRSNWHYKKCRAAEKGNLPDAEYHMITSEDAKKAPQTPITQKKIDEARRDYEHDLAKFRALYFCEPPDQAGNPFGMENIEECAHYYDPDERGHKPDFLKGPPVVFGWDLARSVNYTVGIGLNEHGNVCQTHRWQGRSWDQMKKDILTITGIVPAVMDHTGPGDPMVEFLQNESKGRVIPFKFSAQSKQHLFERLRMAIHQHDIIFEANTPLHEELRHIEFADEAKRARYQAEEGFNDDCVDALGMAWLLYERKNNRSRRKKTLSVGGGDALQNPFD